MSTERPVSPLCLALKYEHPAGDHHLKKMSQMKDKNKIINIKTGAQGNVNDAGSRR